MTWNPYQALLMQSDIGLSGPGSRNHQQPDDPAGRPGLDCLWKFSEQVHF